MLTDLRTELKGVGRLDVLTAVNRRALKYYSDQDLERLPPDSLERRARVLHAMGQDDEARGDHDTALREFSEARRTTAALLAAAPDDPERIFAQAQSEYGFGLIAYQRDRLPEAIAAFAAYKRLADRLVTMAPDNPRYQREAGYADGNSCTIALVPPEHAPEALRSCKAALAHMEVAARRVGPTNDMQNDLVNRHAWLADAYVAVGDIRSATASRLRQERLLQQLIAVDPKNMDLKDSWISLQRALARLEIMNHQQELARHRLVSTLAMLETMIAFDPKNKNWREQHDRIQTTISHLPVTSTKPHGGIQ
jgi:tetratricopeptide (TPR) repeat protein